MSSTLPFCSCANKHYLEEKRLSGNTQKYRLLPLHVNELEYRIVLSLKTRHARVLVNNEVSVVAPYTVCRSVLSAGRAIFLCPPSAKDEDVTPAGVWAAGWYCVDMSVRPGNVCSSSLHFIKSAAGEDV